MRLHLLRLFLLSTPSKNSWLGVPQRIHHSGLFHSAPLFSPRERPLPSHRQPLRQKVPVEPEWIQSHQHKILIRWICLQTGFLLEDGSANMISATVVFDSGSASLRGSKIMLSKTALPKLNQMLAAITRMNEDSCRKIPTRCRGQSTRDLNQISTWSTWKDQRWSIDGIRLVWETYARDRKAHSHAFAMGKKRNPVRGGAR